MPFAPDLRAALKANDRHYMWKLGFRTLLLAVDIALVGMVAWAVAAGQGTDQNLDYYYYYYDIDLVVWDFIPIGVSIIFCSIVLIYQLLRKRPVHPGWDVGVDLLLWMAFGVLAGFTITAGLENLSSNTPSDLNEGIGSSNDGGYYITAANGTEVYIEPNSTQQCPEFTSCAAQQAFLDSITHRAVVEIAIFALMIVALILHFTLFVWGCIDTSARNSNKTSRDAKELAQAMIAEMVASGQIPPPQQPLLYPTASQRASQVGSQMSQENNHALANPAQQAAYQQTSFGYYAPVSQQSPPMGGAHQPQNQWPLQSPAMNEKQAPLQANMPPPPRQAPTPSAGQVLPYAPPPPQQQQQQLQPPPPTSAATPLGRAESPTIPSLFAAAEIGRQSSASPRNGNGWHTPPTQQQSVASSSSDALSGGPAVPTRAPGHTASASRRVSNASHRVSEGGGDLYARG